MHNLFHKCLLFYVLPAVLLSGCRGRSDEEISTFGLAPDGSLDPAAVSGQRAMAEVRSLVAISPRDAGTSGSKKAAEHLASRLEALGLKVEVDTFDRMTTSGIMTFRNVMGTIQGKGKGLIILGSHYDTKSGIAGFQGANDSGSSSGLLLEIGMCLRNRKAMGPDIMLVFFDGEECVKRYGEYDGFHGSKHLAQRLVDENRADSVHAVIVLDMVGDKNLDVWIPANSTPELAVAVMAAAKQDGSSEHFSRPGRLIMDDHIAFLAAGMPAVDIIDFQYGSAPGLNDYWHTPDDTVDKLSADSLATVGRVTIRVVSSLLAKHQ